LNAGTTGGKSAALTAPYTVPADGLFYAGFLQIGATPASVGLLGTNGTTGSWALPGMPWPMAAFSGMADAVTFNPASLAPSGQAVWIGFS
jgi:hypothetical protein